LVSVAEADTDIIVDRDGTSSILIYGAQFETGSYPSSLIKTYGATATRAADDITLATSAFPGGDAAAYSIYYEMEGYNTTGSKQILDLWNGTSTKRIGLYGNSSTARLFVGNSGTQADINSSDNITTAGVHRIAYKAAANDFAITADGATVATDVSGTVPTGLTELSIQGLTLAPYHARRAIVLTRAADNADLESWSSTGDLP